MLESLVQDARHAARSFARTPVFALTSIASLAIGMGATVAVFSLANTLLLSPPPGIGAPERLVSVGRTQDGAGFDNFSYPSYREYRDRNAVFQGLAAMQFEPRAVSLAGPAGGEAVGASVVSGNFFDVLDARPARGRFFLPEEDRAPRAHPVVVLSHRFWRDRFRSDPAIVGAVISLDGAPFTVIGVASAGFHGPWLVAPDLWVTTMASPLLGVSDALFASRASVWLVAIGRLKPGVGASQAQADLSTIAGQLTQTYPDINRGHGVRVLPLSVLPGELQGMARGFLTLLLALSALVLLLAGTNVTGMLLARAAARRREFAVRLAIGASRRRLLQQIATESMVLFLAAGVGGALVARWMIAALMTLVPRLPVQLAMEPRIDLRAFVFALAVSVAVGVPAGLAVALQSVRPALAGVLRGEAGGGGSRLRLRTGLLVAQMAFSMLLLVTGGLFARALARAQAIDPGFDPRGIEVATLDLGLANYDSTAGLRFTEALLEWARAVPGLEEAALSRMLPLGGSGFGLGSIVVPGHEPPGGERGWSADWNIVTPGYFHVLRIPILRGRAFTDADRSGSPPVAIINQTLASRIWPGEDPVGMTFQNDRVTITVIGVARDAKYRSLGEAPRGFVYLPLAQRFSASLALLVRGTPGAALAAPIRRLMARLDPSLPILDQQSLEQYAVTGLFPQRAALWVAGCLGGVALVLAVFGIYGVTAYSVAQRTREIGIRMALGAPKALILRLVLGQGVAVAGAGALLGLLAALGTTRLLANLLFGVSGMDVVAVGGAAFALVLAALAASWLPARRAAEVEPVIALRQE